MNDFPDFEAPWTSQSLTKEELEWAIRYMQDNHSGEVLSIGGSTLEDICRDLDLPQNAVDAAKGRYEAQIPFLPEALLKDAKTLEWQKFARAHEYTSPSPHVVWEAAWLAAEAHFQEKHKYQLVCCPKCDHEFEYEPDLT